MEHSFKLEILTPEKSYFEGEVVSVIVKTSEGFEGFMAGRQPCCKLLAEDGEISFKTKDDGAFKKLRLKKGFVKVGKTMTVFSEEVQGGI